MDTSDLSDRQGTRLRPLLRAQKPCTGRPAKDHGDAPYPRLAHRIGREQFADDDRVEYHRPLTEGSVEAGIALEESLFEGADLLRAPEGAEGGHEHRKGARRQ